MVARLARKDKHFAGAKTGRCPKDKRVVREHDSQQDIWWSDGSNGSPNFEMDDRYFDLTPAKFDQTLKIAALLQGHIERGCVTHLSLLDIMP